MSSSGNVNDRRGTGGGGCVDLLRMSKKFRVEFKRRREFGKDK